MQNISLNVTGSSLAGKRARTLGAPSKLHIVDKENALPDVGTTDPKSVASKRDSLLRLALENRNVTSSWTDLFNFQHEILKAEKISPKDESYERFFTRQLAKDTGSLPQNSYTKLNAWLTLAAFFRSRLGPDETLRVYEYIRDKRIGTFYRQLYETWANFEFSRGNHSEGRKLLDLGVAKKTMKQEQADEILSIFKTTGGDKSVHNNLNSPPVKKTKPSVSNKLTLTASKPSGLRNLGKAVRVVRSGDQSNSNETATSPKKVLSRSHSQHESQTNENQVSSKDAIRHTRSRIGRYLPRISEEHTVDVRELEKSSSETSTPGTVLRSTHLTRGKLATPMQRQQLTGTHLEGPHSSKKTTPKLKLGDLSYIYEWNPDARAVPSKTSAVHHSASVATQDMKQSIDDVHVSDTMEPVSNIQKENEPVAPVNNETISSRMDNRNINVSQTTERPTRRDSNSSASSSSDASEILSPSNDMTQSSQVARVSNEASQRDSLGSRTSDTSSGSPGIHTYSGRGSVAITDMGLEIPGVSGPVSADTRVVSMFAVKNIMYVNNRPYVRLCRSGKGGSSKVYKVLTTDGQILALKKIKLHRTDRDSLVSYQNEITLLQRLRGNPRIIEQIDAEINLEKRYIAVVMEHGEIDLNQLMQERRSLAQTHGTGPESSISLSINFIRLTWMNMLEAVHAIHEERIVHGDLKPANFLFVQGRLKLIDFGIAKAISNDTTNIVRDTQVGTLNYMSPEAIAGTSSGLSKRSGSSIVKLGRASDIWSLGCILYQMVYGHTPFSSLKMIQKIHAITDPSYEIPFPTFTPTIPALLATMKSCLEHNAQLRPGIVGSGGLLEDAFLNSGVSNS